MKKISAYITILLSGLIFTSFALAATPEENTKVEMSGAEVKTMTLATVNIYDATSTKISTSTYSASFQIFNRVGVQSNIRYGLELVKADTNEVVDRKLSNEALTLGAGEFKDIKISYTLPGFIANGDYKLMIVSENQNAIPLAYVPASFPETIISVNTNYDEGILNLENCFVFVNNDQNKKYNLSQGVDIKIGESLSVNCDIKNNSFQDLENLKVQMITHKRSPFGDILNNNFIDKTFSIKAGTSQNISFAIPAMTVPQAYNVNTFILNNDNEKISYSIFPHYVVVGSSATIQNTFIDKADYKKGDIAKATIFFTPAADTFPESRYGGTKEKLTVKASIRNQNKELCGTKTESLNVNDMAERIFEIKIEKDCPEAVATVSILNEAGDVLDTTQINLKNNVEAININPDIKNISTLEVGRDLKSRMSYEYIIILSVIFALIVLGYGIIKLRGEHIISPVEKKK